jgi:hypothetical protein
MSDDLTPGTEEMGRPACLSERVVSTAQLASLLTAGRAGDSRSAMVTEDCGAETKIARLRLTLAVDG